MLFDVHARLRDGAEHRPNQRLLCTDTSTRSCGVRAGREEAAEGEEAGALGALAGQLTAAREGLRPVGQDELEAAAARLGSETAAGHEPEDSRRDAGGGNGAFPRGSLRAHTLSHRSAAGQTSVMRFLSRLAWLPHAVRINLPRESVIGCGLSDYHGNAVTACNSSISCSGGGDRHEAGLAVGGLTAAEAAAVARRMAALTFAPQTLAATEQRVRAWGTHSMMCCTCDPSPTSNRTGRLAL